MLRSILSALILAALPLTAVAQETSGEDIAVNTRFGAWTVACQAVTTTRNVCRLVQEQVLTETGTLVVRLISQPLEDGGAVLLAQVPMGVWLPGGAVWRLEQYGEPEQNEMIWQRCFGDVCEAVQVLDAATIEAMQAAGNMLFGYSADPGADPVVVRVGLDGYRDGIEVLRASGD